jgi:release factor glutamine methyltransferase
MHFTSGVLARLLLRSGVVQAGASVLDLGTGSGLAAIAAALAGAGRVVATDINPAAVRSAGLNVKRHRLEDKVSVKEGDMFDPVRTERFDLVVCNPPYFRGEPDSMAGRAYYAGPEFEWLQRFGSDLADHLTPGGSAIISIGDAADITSIRTLLAGCGWTCEEVARRDIIVETIYLFRLTHTAGGNFDGR